MAHFPEFPLRFCWLPPRFHGGKFKFLSEKSGLNPIPVVKSQDFEFPELGDDDFQNSMMTRVGFGVDAAFCKMSFYCV